MTRYYDWGYIDREQDHSHKNNEVLTENLSAFCGSPFLFAKAKQGIWPRSGVLDLSKGPYDVYGSDYDSALPSV